MSQSNRRGQRGAARKKYIAFALKPTDTVWSQSGKCLSCMKYSWFLHTWAHKQHTNAASCVTIPPVQNQTCLLCPASKALAYPSALPAQHNQEILVAEGISNILAIPQLNSCKIHTFSLLQSEHVTGITWKQRFFTRKLHFTKSLKCPKGTGKALSQAGDTLRHRQSSRVPIFLYTPTTRASTRRASTWSQSC